MTETGAAAPAITLAGDGKPRAVIIADRNASPPEKRAAAELAAFLTQATGARFGVSERDTGQETRLLVGEGAARLADPGFSAADLGQEGIRLQTLGSDIILAGGRPRGTLYAVYTFLEDYVGCRWWTPDAGAVPSKPTLTVPPLNVRYVPTFEYRESFWKHALDPDWNVRNKCNGTKETDLDESRGGGHVYEGFVHTFYELIPPDTYFDEHPEWFAFSSLFKHRMGGTEDVRFRRSQLCLTNEEMRRELVRNLKKRLRANPQATIASVSQNDFRQEDRNPCRCPECEAIDREEGSPSGLLLRFVNAVAADIEKEFPHVAIDTLAYQYTRKPPALTRPRPNVIVRLCSIECTFDVPLTHERNRSFADDIAAWSKVCRRLYVWNYDTNFKHYFMPFPNLGSLGPNLRFFAAHRVRGVFEQGAYNTAGTEMAELRAWVLAKLLWNPELDTDKLIEEFTDGYYGAGAPHVRAYLKVIHDAVAATGDNLTITNYEGMALEFLNYETMAGGWRRLADAEEAVKNDPELLSRVRTARLPVLYIFLMKWKEFRKQADESGPAWPVPSGAQDVFDLFMQTAQEQGITRVTEFEEGFDPLVKAVAEAGG